MKILVVEDDQDVAETLKLLLSNYMYAVDVAWNSTIALQMVDAFEYDLILLDILLPDMDGITLCQQLRAKKFQMPILLLTGQNEGRQKAIALNAGADDYMIKPFDSEELIARVQALLRRGGAVAQPILEWGHLCIHPDSRRATYGTYLLSLTPKEYAILELFLRNGQKVFSASAILGSVWDSAESPGEEAVRVHIKEIRQKLKAADAPVDLIKTVYRLGYRLNPLYSSTLATQLEQQPTLPQVAELKSVNQELRFALEALQATKEELRRQNQELAIARQQAERALHDSETKLSDILNHAIACVVSIRVFADRTWQYDYYSAGCEAIFGYTPAEMITGLWLSRIPPEDQQTIFAIMFDAIFAERSAHLEYRFHHKDGSLRWISSDITSHRESAHNCWQVIAVDTDITERKRMEAALQASEERYRIISELTSDFFYTCDVTPSGTLIDTWASQKITEFIGYPLEDLSIGEDNWFKFIHPDDLSQVRAFVERLIRSNQADSLEYRVIDDQGNTRWICDRVQPIWDALTGRVVKLIGAVEDISDRKRSEAERKQAEAELRETSTALSNAVEGISRLDSQGHYVSVNEAYARMVGYTPSEMIGMNWQTTVHADDLEQLMAAYQQMLDTGKVEIAARGVCKNGSVFHKQLLLVAVYDEQQLFAGHYCFMKDISEKMQFEAGRQQAEIALRQSEEKFRAIFNSTFQFMGLLTPDGIVVELNQTALDAIATDRANVIGKPFWETPWWQHFPEQQEQLQEAIACAARGELVRFESQHIWADGTFAFVDFSLKPYLDQAGNVIMLIPEGRDITDRRRAEQKIREQAALIDIATDAFLVCNLESQILFWNQGAEHLYGWAAAEAVGQSINTFLRKRPSSLKTEIESVLRTGIWQGEIEKITKTGETVLVSTRWKLMQNQSGQPASILIVDTDITEKKKLENQFYHSQRLESLGTLASGIAHDLNNVLTPILAISQLIRLKQQNLDERSQEMLKTLEESAKRGANLVKQILTFSRGTEGKRITLQPKHILLDVAKVIEQTFPKSIAIRTNILADPLNLISADPTQLHQVLMNLCVNARDAMPNGGVLTLTIENFDVDEIFAQMHLDAEVGNYIAISVTDTGVGIPPEFRDRIFDPFFTTKAVGQGTGLGLSTVLGIVKNYGGFLQVSSELGEGTEFKVYLPSAKGSATENHSPEELLQGNGECVLIVDDDIAIQQTNQSLLESRSYKTLIASDGAEALSIYTHYKDEIKAVLIDVMMPNMDGITAIQMFKRINPHVKILAVSGLASYKAQVLSAGASAFLTKPYTVKSLLKQIHTLLSDRQANTE